MKTIVLYGIVAFGAILAAWSIPLFRMARHEADAVKRGELRSSAWEMLFIGFGFLGIVLSVENPIPVPWLVGIIEHPSTLAGIKLVLGVAAITLGMRLLFTSFNRFSYWYWGRLDGSGEGESVLYVIRHGGAGRVLFSAYLYLAIALSAFIGGYLCVVHAVAMR